MKFILSILVSSLSFHVANANNKLDTLLYHHAINAPQELNQDFDKLISYLIEPTNSEREQLQVVSYWIADNIKYDLESYNSNSIKASTYSSTLTRKKAVCQGYSELFKEFCDYLEIECHVISGYSKGYSYQFDQKIVKIDHAWNVVKLSDEYILFDLTWACGGIYDSSLFIKKLDRSYLFANPTEFIEKHLPSQERWQLLYYPISIESYQNNVNYEDMIDSTSLVYNFPDSIASYLELDSYDRKMKDLKDAYIVFPSELNLAQLNYYMAYVMTYGKYDEERYNQCIKLFKIAQTIYLKPEYNRIAFAESCQEYIDFINQKLNK